MNDNITNIIKLPIQLTPIDAVQTDDELAAEMRVRLTRRLNEVAAGQRELTPKLKQSVQKMNAIFLRSGYPLIDADF